MEYGIDYYNASDRIRPDVWAAQREAEGWHVLGTGDHVRLDGRWAFHAFACLGAMAARTETATLATMFADNVVRSPVEFAQFALTMHSLSNGRFEAGIGAGWDDQDALLVGVAGLTPPERARRYREALTVVRQLFSGSCDFEGEFYSVRLESWGPIAEAPSLFASVGGPWGARHIAPLVDRVEVFPSAVTLRGEPDVSRLAGVTRDDVRRLVDDVRAANPDAAVGVGVMAIAGEHPLAAQMEAAFGPTYLGQFYGSAARVADAVRTLRDDLELDRVSVLAPMEGTAEALAPELLPGH